MGQSTSTSERRGGRRFPIGVEIDANGGGAHARLWAPARKSVEVVVYGGDGAEGPAHPLEPDGDGYFAGFAAGMAAGTRYRFRLDGGGGVPRPAAPHTPQ